MKTICINFVISTIILLLCGCHQESIIQPANIEFEGIDLYSNDNGLYYLGTISNNETDFKISSNKLLTRVGINGTIFLDMNGKPELEGYWGSISVSNSHNFYLYQIHINTNNSTKNRHYLFKFGNGNTYSIINIQQYYIND